MKDIIGEIIDREGGFVNDPADTGGATKYGITIATLANWRGHPVTVEDVQNLTVDEARSIYSKMYILDHKIDKIPTSMLQSNIIDYGVMSGPKTAIMNVQAILGLKTDGVLGPVTLKAILSTDLRKLNNELVKRRILNYARIVQNQPKKLKFLYGWLKRVTEFWLT